MRGEEWQQRSMLMVFNLEQRIPQDHPLRRIKQLAETVLRELSPSFDRMYSATGRPSIPPERLLKGSLLMALYTIRSERLFCEQLDYNLLFRWFLDMELDEPSFDHSSFSANRKRLLEREVAGHQPFPEDDFGPPIIAGQTYGSQFGSPRHAVCLLHDALEFILY